MDQEMNRLQAIVDGLGREIRALREELQAAERRGDARTAGRCKAAISPRTQIRNRRRAELRAAKERAARAA